MSYVFQWVDLYIWRSRSSVMCAYQCSAVLSVWRCWFPAEAPVFQYERDEWRNPRRTPSTPLHRHVPCVRRWPLGLDELQTSVIRTIRLLLERGNRGGKKQSSTSSTKKNYVHDKKQNISKAEMLALSGILCWDIIDIKLTLFGGLSEKLLNVKTRKGNIKRHLNTSKG